jgi:hypothetical protein
VTRIEPLSVVIAIAAVSSVTSVTMAPATRRATRLGPADVMSWQSGVRRRLSTA